MLVSIITPSYEGEKYMQDYMDCIIKNRDNLEKEDELEVIIVNDSPWKKLEIPPDFDACDFVRIITNSENKGIHASRVEGLEAAKGQYVMFLDQDDVIADNAVAVHISHIRKLMNEDGKTYENCGIVSVSNAVLEQSDNTSVLWYRTDYHKKCVDDLKTYVNVGIQIISPGQCLIKKDVIPVFWKENIMSVNGADDYFLWILLLFKAVCFRVIDEPLYIHRYTGENISADTKKTDESTYEFLEILGENDAVNKEIITGLLEMISFKAAFREAGKIGKISVGLSNPKLLWANIKYKRKTKTKLGFNR